MREWCLEHPYLTFISLLWTSTLFMGICDRVIDLFKKPKPVDVSFKMDPVVVATKLVAKAEEEPPTEVPPRDNFN